MHLEYFDTNMCRKMKQIHTHPNLLLIRHWTLDFKWCFQWNAHEFSIQIGHQIILFVRMNEKKKIKCFKSLSIFIITSLRPLFFRSWKMCCYFHFLLVTWNLALIASLSTGFCFDVLYIFSCEFVVWFFFDMSFALFSFAIFFTDRSSQIACARGDKMNTVNSWATALSCTYSCLFGWFIWAMCFVAKHSLERIRSKPIDAKNRRSVTVKTSMPTLFSLPLVSFVFWSARAPFFTFQLTLTSCT